ncbi:MAG: glycoside hydrolase family 5 protein [Actinomycetota bacterium]
MVHRSAGSVLKLVALGGVAALATLAFPSAQPAAAAPDAIAPTVSPAPALHVKGNEIVDSAGQPVQLNGVNRSGAEYMCVGGNGVFDGPTDAESVAAMRTWHVHVVRIPLNEDCWLGINGVVALDSGPRYQRAIQRFVATIEAAGMDVILDLHTSAPGGQLAVGQREMPDADHSPDFWQSVAQTFGHDPAVMFDLYNEPHDVSWSCWRDGCSVGSGSQAWRAAGMQQLVDVVRAIGATNILMVGGLGWAGDLSDWRRWMPVDPLHQLVASWHVYSFGGCVTPSCWNANVGAVSGAAPILIGEFGELGCRHGFVDRFMRWADGKHGGNGLGYVAWTWDNWSTCDGPTLITDYRGRPTGYGVGVRRHFRARFP